MAREVHSLESLSEIRTALRKRTVQAAIYKNQAENGARCQTALCAYIDLMSEEECKEFLDSVREAPFIPGMNMMWTEEVSNYLMFGDLPSNMRYSMDRCSTFEEYAKKSANIDPAPYRTEYVKKCVDEQYWNLLPLGGVANYYSPSQVLRLAIIFHSSSNMAQYIAEKLFIKAADLEDCLKPTTKVPKPLPLKPRHRKSPQKKVVLQVPEGARVSIDVHKGDTPVVPKLVELPKAEVPQAAPRKNRLLKVTPAFAASDKAHRRSAKAIQELDAVIMARYKPFGGDCTALQLGEILGVNAATIYDRAYRIKRKTPTPAAD